MHGARHNLCRVRGTGLTLRGYPSSGSLRLPPSPTRGEGKTSYAGVKNGSGAPSVGLNTTFTFWPIFSLSMSQSTILVCSDGPSFSVT